MLRGLLLLLLLPSALTDEQPALPTTSVPAVLPPSLVTEPAATVPAFASASVHADALIADPLHGDAFVVHDVLGDKNASRIIYLVPQFHRNPIVPITWNSLGAGIIEVQRNLAALTTRLGRSHGLRCIGTEGEWAERIDTPLELVQIARWSAELTLAKDRFLALHESDQVMRGHITRLHDVLQAEIRKTAAILDGVGMAQVRNPDLAWQRFGLEDAALNQRSLALLDKLKAIDDKLALLEPDETTPVQSALGELWLLEIDDYEKDTLQYLRKCIPAIDAHRIELRQRGADIATDRLRRFIALAKLVAERTVRLAEVDAHTAYYRKVAAAKETKPPPKRVGQSADIARLHGERETVLRAYNDVAFDAREEMAVRRVLRRTAQGSSCMLVMGMAHQRGLIDKLTREKDLGVVVVTPYDIDRLKAGAP